MLKVGSGLLRHRVVWSSSWRSYKIHKMHEEHVNVLPTYHFQNCLPRLPIPTVEDTLNRYVESLGAMVGHPQCSEEDVVKARQLCDDFIRKDARLLQETIQHIDSVHTNTSYITAPWFDMYLESRTPLPLNYNPFMLFKRDPVEKQNHQTTRATNIICSALKFKESLESERLAPEVFYMGEGGKSLNVQRMTRLLPNNFMLRYLPMMKSGAYPLDMSQFGNLLNSTRIPHKGKDVLKTYPDSRHIVVMHRGNFFKVNVLDAKDNNRIMNPKKIRSCLNLIKQQDLVEDQLSVAHLTTCDRDHWAQARAKLCKIGVNEADLYDVDSAIFCLVLEDDSDTTSPAGSVSNFLHGGARWYDKSFSLIVASNGDTALNFEHSWGDGVAVVRFFNDVFRDSTLQPELTEVDTFGEDVAPDSVDNLRYIKFELDEEMQKVVRRAKHEYDDTRNNLYAAGGLSDKLNKNFLKEQKISPDGVIQLAIQMGHYYVHGHPAPTYESCSTSAFKHGRTETVRSCSKESMLAVRAVCEKGGSTDDVRKLIEASCAKHNLLTKNAATGAGFDRHMFALKHAAEVTLGLRDQPKLFSSSTYKLMNSIVLSTSTLNSAAIQFGGFAPVTPEGYGIGYGVREEGVGVNVTAYGNQDKADQLSQAIVRAYEDIYNALK